MINVVKLSSLLKQTKLIPAKDITLMKTIVKKINKGQRLTPKQKEFYNDVATQLSMEPMLDNSALFEMTKRILKKGK
jgi:hypothetical protein